VEDLLVPSKLFCAAAAAVQEVIPPIPANHLTAGRAAVLSGMLFAKINAMLAPVYGEKGAPLYHRSKLRKRARTSTPIRTLRIVFLFVQLIHELQGELELC
jgi:hypothetical protein